MTLLKNNPDTPRILLLRRCLLGAVLMLAGCATYHPLPLATRPDLAGKLSQIRHVVPAAPSGRPAIVIDLDKPLRAGQIGLLAVLNDPALRAERGEMESARAGLLQASLLPDPSLGLGQETLLGGPATSDAYSASLSQDIGALLTYRARRHAARAGISQVNAQLLWREWQVAQKARLLAIDLYWDAQSITTVERAQHALGETARHARAAMSAGDIDASTLSPVLAAQASMQQTLSSLRLTHLHNWQSLDALLNLSPDVHLHLARPATPELPANLDVLITDAPQRRPDLIALRLGYESSEQEVRAAILGQFPSLVLGGSWNSDTSRVRSAGPTLTLSLPIFNRNQGEIARRRATRQLLHDQYQARIDTSAHRVRSLVARIRQLTGDADAARQIAATSRVLAENARKARARGDLDLRTYSDYESAAAQRQIEANTLRRNLDESYVGLDVELGLGLPRTRIAPAKPDAKP